MSLLLAALRTQPLHRTDGLWLLPTTAQPAGGQTMALALAAADAATVICVPWSACDAGHWPQTVAHPQVWWVADAPPRALTAAVRKRLARLPARAIVLQGALADAQDLTKNNEAVAHAMAAVAAWVSAADAPLVHLGLAALEPAHLAAHADTLVDFADLLDRTVLAALAAGPHAQPPDPAQWQAWRNAAVAAAAVARFEALGPRPARAAIALWLGSVRRLVDADDRTVRLLRRAGLLRTDANGLGWAAIARTLSQPALGRAVRAARPDWPWHLAGFRDGVDPVLARQVVGVFAGCVVLGGLQPRSDGALERLGVTALRQAIDQSFDRNDPTRRALGPWIDLTARLTTLAAAHWRTDDVQHLRQAEAARQRLAEAATTAGARFSVAALFDALRLLDACAKPDVGEVMRCWTSLQWTLERMGQTARPTLAWLRLVVARSCVGQSSPAQHPYWAAELQAAEQELGTLQTFAPAVQRTQAWLAWSQGDGRRAQELWAASGNLAGRHADAAGAVDSALDLAMSLLVTGEPEAALRIARPLAQRLTTELDRERAPWAVATWILASLCADPQADVRTEQDPDAAHAHPHWQAAMEQVGDAGRDEVVDLGGLVRCAALLTDGRSSEAQPLLTWAARHARKNRLPAFATAAQLGLAFCYLWAGDETMARKLLAEAQGGLPTPTGNALLTRSQQLAQPGQAEAVAVES